MVYSEDEWSKHFYDAFVEWLANRYVVAKQNQYSNWFIFKEKIFQYIRENKSVYILLNQIGENHMFVYAPTKKKVFKLKEGKTAKEAEEYLPGCFEVEYPSEEQINNWMVDDICETPCGCAIEPDGYCEHGNPSWLIILGLI